MINIYLCVCVPEECAGVGREEEGEVFAYQ